MATEVSEHPFAAEERVGADEVLVDNGHDAEPETNGYTNGDEEVHVDGEHEAADHVNGAVGDKSDEVEDEEVDQTPDQPTTDGPDDVPAAPIKPKAAVTDDAKINRKPSPVKTTTTGRTASGPPTPLVKKILNSGTYGPGAAKPPPFSTKAPTVGKISTVAPLAATLKKAPTTTTTAPVVKPLTATTTTTKTPTNSPPAPTNTTSGSSDSAPRRLSTTVTKPVTKPTATAPGRAVSSTATKTATKPSTTASPAKPSSTSAVRKPVTSPTPSTASTAPRPRAPVTEGAAAVKKPASARTASISVAKPAASASSASAVKHKTAPSVASVKENIKAQSELEDKLREATASISAKSDQIVALELQVEGFTDDLKTKEQDVEEKQAALSALQAVKDASDLELASLKAALDAAKASTDSQVQQTIDQLQKAQADLVSGTENTQALEASLAAAKAELEATKASLEAFTSSSTSSADEIAQAAALDREALVKAKADLDAIKAEAEALTASHGAALQESSAKIQELEAQAALVEGLQAQIAEAISEKEELTHKISELEVEILELKEAAEVASEEQQKLNQRVKELETELADKVEGHRVVLEELEASATSARAQHQVDQEAAVQAANDVAAAATASLKDELSRLQTDLEGQEGKYSQQLAEAKAEHDRLLDQSFDKAKGEAGAEHAQELQVLREEAKANMDRLLAGHQTALQEMKAAHEADLENEVKTLEKQLANQNLELRATQEDLNKAKSAAAAALGQVETVTAQLQAAREAATSGASPDAAQAAETARLKARIADAEDELSNVKEAFNMSKDSFMEISGHHARELEEGAAARVKELADQRAAFEDEKTKILAEKAAIASALEDEREAKERAFAQLASASTLTQKPSRAMSPGRNGMSSPGVSREELQKLHEAHNAKLSEIDANHDKELRSLKEELAATAAKLEEAEADASRKTMEVQFLESEKEDSQDEINQLKAELDALKEGK